MNHITQIGLGVANDREDERLRAIFITGELEHSVTPVATLPISAAEAELIGNACQWLSQANPQEGQQRFIPENYLYLDYGLLIPTLRRHLTDEGWVVSLHGGAQLWYPTIIRVDSLAHDDERYKVAELIDYLSDQLHVANETGTETATYRARFDVWGEPW